MILGHGQGRRVLVTGGAGYVGAVLVPKLLRQGWRVRVLDLLWFGEQVLDAVREHAGLEVVRGDLRDPGVVVRSVAGCDAVIHLACISNDPSFELDPALGKSINYDAFRPLVEAARDAGVRRFIYASSSSVYGVKQEERVTEDLSLEPLTDYSKFKALCEDVLRDYQSPDFTTVILRPATVCGYSPRLRLDLTVNILTNHAYHNGRIRVFGGAQYRPNLHIEDMTDLYVRLLELPDDRVAGRTWNAGYENHTVLEIASQVRGVLADRPIEIVQEPTDDLRSYRICSDRIRRDIGFVPQHTIAGAAEDLVTAFRAGRIPDSMTDPRYYNIKTMQLARWR
ncbi:MAG: NAD-dependent epimerase/dehydratase family protein [Candidatus Anammoximicrobium sp.]|nr:NAD-dependent epimerase/dehydratase family protein [Candidatus Anammoximicrobium sp.]